MTLEEIKSEYGDVPLEFLSYNKFTFTFTGETKDGLDIYVNIGGCADDIYKLNFFAGKNNAYTINTLDPNSIEVINFEDGTRVCSWNNH
jgi:hypothetical protein